MQIRNIQNHELQKLGALRYQIYVEEMARPQHYADHDRKLIIDPLDCSAINLVAEHEGEFVGTVRYNRCSSNEVSTYIDFYELHGSADQIGRSSICTRLMVLPTYRGSRVPLMLACAVYETGLLDGIEYNYIDCNAHLLPFFTRLGYDKRFNKTHEEYGDVTCMQLKLKDIEHLRSRKSPFLKILQETQTGEST